MNRKKWIGLGVLLILVGGIGFGATRRRHVSAVSYTEHRVERSDLDVTILSTGTVQPENRLEIKPPIAGRIEEVRVKEGDRVKKGQILAWMSTTERAALLDAARTKGAEELKKWEDFYRPAPIMAAIDGMIIQRNAEPGQTFTTSDAVLVMSDRLTVKAEVDETDIAQIKLQQKASIVLDAYPGQSMAARVDQIAFDAKTVNNVTTYIVDVLPEKTPDFMRSGMTANVVFSVASKQDVLVVPNAALKVRHDERLVLSNPPKKGDAPVERRVETGLTDGKRTEILSGLAEGEMVLSPEVKTSDENSVSGSNPFSPMAPRKQQKK